MNLAIPRRLPTRSRSAAIALVEKLEVLVRRPGLRRLWDRSATV